MYEYAIDHATGQPFTFDVPERDFPSGTPRKTYFRNRGFYFRPGLTYSVVSSGRVSVRLLPEGWIFGHKGSAVFVEDGTTSERFLLGYLNSVLATYFMKRLVNTTATADVGYLEKLPYRKPSGSVTTAVVERVDRIVATLQADPDANVEQLREEIDDSIFDLFEIGPQSRELVRHFYGTVGRVEVADDQATSE